MNSPIKWMGGKYRLRKQIVEIMPKHTCYCEPFGGAGWVLFEKEPSKVEVYNDVNSELVNFFKVVKNKTDDFIKAFDYILISRELFEEFKEVDINKLSDIERAVRFYYLIHLSFGSRMKNFVINPTRVAGQGKKVLENLENDVKITRQRLINTIIENRDFEQVLKSYDRDATFFYCDPPYYELTDYNSQGSGSFSNEDHLKLRDSLAKLKGKFLLSINDHPEVREMYKDFNILGISVKYSVCRVDNSSDCNELLIANYDIDLKQDKIG